MEVVKTLEDVEKIRQSGTVGEALLERVEMAFRSLHVALGGDVGIEDFSLEHHGPIGIWEQGDKDLSALGLQGTLEDSWPEFITRVELPADGYYFRVGHLFSNDFLTVLYIHAETSDPKLLSWLEENAEDGEGGEYDVCQTEPF